MTQAHRGRPRSPRKAGERATLRLRITADLFERLDAEARRKGRALSNEAEQRLERSFERGDLLREVLELAYGQQAGALLALIGRIMNDVGPMTAFQAAGNNITAAATWLLSPQAFEEVAEGIATAIEALRPTAPIERDQALVGRGRAMATGTLIAIKDRECGGELGEWARPVREGLGEEIVDHIAVDPNAPIMISAWPPLQTVQPGATYQGHLIDTHMGCSIGRRGGESE